MAVFAFTCLAIVSATVAHGDALVQSQAMKASNIAQYYIEDQQVRVELEIGLESLPAFRNLMPDGIYREMGFGDDMIEQRLPRFFEQDLALLVDGEPLPKSSPEDAATISAALRANVPQGEAA